MPGQFISHLRLSHFRSHRATEIFLDGRIVVLCGPNGAGKTNALEAVSLFSPGRGLRSSSAEEISRRPGEIGWKVSGQLDTPDRKILLETFSRDGSPRRALVDGKPSKLADLALQARILWLTPAMDRIWIEGAAGRRRFVDRISMSFFPEHARAAIGYEKAMRERNRLLKDKVSNDGWYDALERQMALQGVRVARNRRRAVEKINQAQSDSRTGFPIAELSIDSNCPNCSAVESERDLATALSECRRRDLAAGRSLVGPHRADLETTLKPNQLPAGHCSTGEQKALLVSIVLANARALMRDLRISPVLLLDEVCAHLDEDRRNDLYEEIMSLELQAWVTGTDSGLFGRLGADAQRFSVINEDGNSAIRQCRSS
ncbi:MAG: DNA replication/repair protein RecF [Albidovulum sp.]|nr:DNA replication/repair protein RecF [Albidovulum sp.]